MDEKIVVKIRSNVRVGFSTDALMSLGKKILREHLKKKSFFSKIITVIFTDDSGIKKINKTYRGQDQVTDVLSFSYINEENYKDEISDIGEVYINLQAVNRQSKLFGYSKIEEACILLTHGVLHVLGYDHDTKKELNKMMKMERKYIGDKSGLIQRHTSE